jgi:hypothetical protein
MKKYNNNEEFFSKWSKDMAYILGFVTADGYVSDVKWCVQISLQERDVEILEYIKKCISPERPIYYYKREIKISNAGNIGSYVRLNISSKDIVKSLVKFGIIPRKTGKETLPIGLPDLYIGDYLRGLFDGDGTAYSSKYCPLSISICSASKDFLTSLKNLTGLGKIGTVSTIWNWRLDTRDSIKMKHIMYDNGGFCLKRKKDIIMAIPDDISKISRYTDDDYKIIRSLYNDGYTAKEIIKHIKNRSAKVI